jgi:hypothetical protein
VCATLAAILILLPAKLLAGPPTLAFPLDCDLGQTCFIQQYVDTDPTQGARDFTCGPLSYDGHKGTDIRLANRAQIKGDGVAVHASAAGTIRGTRSNMPDVAQGETDAPDITNRECGNGVVIDHGEGWKTQYCHMRKDSIQVATGQQVQQGDILGLVGLSGLTQFPHVHIKVSNDGKTVDPFNVSAVQSCDQTDKIQLWEAPIAYRAGGFLSAGFASEVLDFQAIKQGPPPIFNLPRNAPAIVVWGFMYGLQEGDELTLFIARPDGTTLLENRVKFDRNQAQAYRLTGKRRGNGFWKSGIYGATLTLRRGNAVISSRNIQLQID